MAPNRPLWLHWSMVVWVDGGPCEIRTSDHAAATPLQGIERTAVPAVDGTHCN